MQHRLGNTRCLGLLAAVLVLVSVACGGPNPVASSASKTLSPSPLQDCRGAAELDPHSAPPGQGVTFVNLTVDGKLRDYRVFSPPGLDISKPIPLVIMLHGATIDAQGVENNIHFDSEASIGGFLSVSPNGCDGKWSYADGGPKTADDDFIQTVMQQVEANFRIDKARVFLVGGSAGTWVAYRLACDMADQITAIASIAGTMRLTDGCQPSRPVSILEMHGTRDNAHPWNGGGPHYAFPVDDVMKRWVMLNGCAVNPTVTQSGITETSIWKQCQGGAVVRLDKVVDGRHTWFGSDLDPVPGEPNANAVIWSFFSGLHHPTL